MFSEQSSSRYIADILYSCTANWFDIFISCQKCTFHVDEFVCLGSRSSTSGGGGLGLEGNLVIWWIGVVAEWSLVGYVVPVSLYCVCMFHYVHVFPCIFVWVPMCVSEWWSMYASHSCPSLSVFLPLWGLHVIFSNSGLQARKHIHILHLHTLQPPLLGWLWNWLHMGFRWVQIGYSVLVLGRFYKIKHNQMGVGW